MLVDMSVVHAMLVAAAASTPRLRVPTVGAAVAPRRSMIFSAAAALLPTGAANALVDCTQDCLQNCNRLAGGSPGYCKTSCNEYCAQGERNRLLMVHRHTHVLALSFTHDIILCLGMSDDRRDGLSGSVSTEGAEFGWASAFKNPFAPQKPVVYGTDLPPGLPDVLGVNAALRKSVAGGSSTTLAPSGVQGRR